MTTTQTIAVVVGVAMLIGYPIFMRFLAERMQPSRLKMADVGKLLLEHPDLSQDHKKLIRSMLDDAYSPVFMIMLTIVTPVFGPLAALGIGPSMPTINNLEARELFDNFTDRYNASISAANPLFSIIAAIEMALLTIVLFPIGQLSRTHSVQFGSVRVADNAMHLFRAGVRARG